jgi:hypothetical protein
MCVSLSSGPADGVGGRNLPNDLCAQRSLQPEPTDPYISLKGIMINPGYSVTNFFESCHPCTAVLVKQSSIVAHEGSDKTGIVGQLFEKDRVSCTRQQTSYFVVVLERVMRLVSQAFFV